MSQNLLKEFMRFKNDHTLHFSIQDELKGYKPIGKFDVYNVFVIPHEWLKGTYDYQDIEASWWIKAYEQT